MRTRIGETALACGELVSGPPLGRRGGRRRRQGWHLAAALATRARVESEQGEPFSSTDAHEALASAAGRRAPDAFPTSWNASPTWRATPTITKKRRGSLAPRTRCRQRMGACGSRSTTPTTRPRSRRCGAMGEDDFDAAWAEGAALSTKEAIAYAQRGRGERKRPTTGWGSLTPTELDVVRLVCEGMANKDIATRLFISPRTVQSHLTPRLHQARLHLPRTARARGGQTRLTCRRTHHRRRCGAYSAVQMAGWRASFWL